MSETIYQRALRLHGEDNQVNMAIEEAAEFIVAANHRRRGRHKDIYQFAEEIADNEIMMLQMRLLTPRGMVDRIKREKLARLKKRLNQHEKDERKKTFEKCKWSGVTFTALKNMRFASTITFKGKK